ncbi:MAG: M1 family aminopeptidase [Candidatus Korobacteraceae bacterium]
MNSISRRLPCLGFVSFFLVLAMLPRHLSAQARSTPPQVPEAYQALRRPTLGNESVRVTNFVFRRDAASFNFKSGVFTFYAPVEGRVTGAVFIGDGEFRLTPPTVEERESLSYLSRQTEFVEEFGKLVLRFTDSTHEEIKAAGEATEVPSPPTSVAEDVDRAGRRELRYNYPTRILQDVLSPEQGQFFAAFIDGRRYSNRLLFTLDPRGVEEVAPEEVSLMTYSEGRYGIWAAFHLSGEYSSGKASGAEQNAAVDVASQKIRVEIARNGHLKGDASTTFAARSAGLRVVSFDLFRTLRVQRVLDEQEQPLQFIQEHQDEDSQLWVVLPKALAAGETFTIRTIYEGKDAIRTEGSGNYFPVARSNWYPSSGFGDYATYELTFSVPKNLQIVATGDRVSEATQRDQSVSVWKSDTPLAVAGFNLGDFRREEAKLEKLGYTLESYANKNPPNFVRELQNAAENSQPSMIGGASSFGGSPGMSVPLGTMNTTQMMKKPLAEAQIAMRLYTDYFGPVSYKRLSMTQQTACNFGQSWPGLVYLPICSFFDSTVRHLLGLTDERGYWRVVGPHEVAHQWWGHAVGFNSYRDQWISEGFSDFSAALFIQVVWAEKPEEFRNFWKDELDLITERNKEGFRPIDVGPITQGHRLMNSRVGVDIYRRLIYPKGAFILHMIRMMMWDDVQEKRFRTFMRDYVKTARDRVSSTEEFKAVLERHMTREMDLEGNGRMDWFFRQYVYGVDLPRYALEYSFEKENDQVVLVAKATQSGVGSNFRMLVPVYAEMANGRILRLGSLPIQGNNTVAIRSPIPGLKDIPKRAMLNYQYDVLAEPQ